MSLFSRPHIVPRPPWPSVDYEVSRGGDSGSVWINEATGRAVGLHFAGETDPAPTSENALANPMHKVAAASDLNFSFTPRFFCPRVPPKVWRDPIKPMLADIPVKSLAADFPPKSLIDPVKLPGLEGSLPFDPSGPVVFPAGPLTRGGGVAPFAFATPHHFGGGAGVGGQSTLAQLDALIAHYQALRSQLSAEEG